MIKEQENKIIISTRPKGKSEDLRNLFEAEGYSLIEFPMIDIHAIELNDAIKNKLNTLYQYSYVAFTSANAFRIFHDFLIDLNLVDFFRNRVKIASIGYKTSKIIRSYGYSIDFDTQSKTGHDFAKKMKSYLNSGSSYHILWPTGNLSPNILADTLQPECKVTRIDIYENTYPENVDKNIANSIHSNDYHMIIVASPSAIINLNRTINIKDIKIACIGNTTAKAAIDLGIKPTVIAEEPSALGIFNAVSALSNR